MEKQEYVLETHDQYPKKVCFQLFGADRIAQAAIQPGEELTVSFDIESREYMGNGIPISMPGKLNALQQQLLILLLPTLHRITLYHQALRWLLQTLARLIRLTTCRSNN